MDDSGRILTDEEIRKLSKFEQEKFVELELADVPEVEGMNRHERRKWYALNYKKRKKFEF